MYIADGAQKRHHEQVLFQDRHSIHRSAKRRKVCSRCTGRSRPCRRDESQPSEEYRTELVASVCSATAISQVKSLALEAWRFPSQSNANNVSRTIFRRAIPAAPKRIGRRSGSARSQTLRSSPKERRLFKILDNSSWRNLSSEDNLSEFNTRNGFFDKPGGSLPEYSSGRHALWNSMQHLTLLKDLCSTLVTAIDSRAYNGRVIQDSTVKPPPRVALTDTKRETWLQDLSNSSVALRRLSRTIPHGIRGRAILDHCLQKKIPTGRAIWLIKCIGSNELRASKRKGIGGVSFGVGELLWYKEWTTHCEQFVETMATQCNEYGWESRMRYGSGLIYQLLWSRLIDRNQFVEWLVEPALNTSLEYIKAWLILMSHYTPLLLNWNYSGSRRRSLLRRQLECSRKVERPRRRSSEIPETLSAFNSTVLLEPMAFIVAETSGSHDSLQSDPTTCSSMQSRMATCVKQMISEIRFRGTRVVDVSSAEQARVVLSLTNKVSCMLDDAWRTRSYEETSKRCIIEGLDQRALTRTCVAWLCRDPKPLQQKIYVSARLISIWNCYDMDIQLEIHHILRQDTHIIVANRSAFHGLVAELVRRKIFSIPKYLQWLLSQQARPNSQTELGESCCFALLLELPLYGLSAQILNLRNALLKRCGVQENEEANALRGMIRELRQAFPKVSHLRSCDASNFTSDINLREFGRSSISIKFAISEWLYKTALADVRALHCADWSQTATQFRETEALDPSSTHIFELLRIFFALGDFSTTARFMRSIACFATCQTMLQLVDSTNYFIDIFLALDTATELFQAFTDRALHFDHNEEIFTVLVESLKDLESSLPWQSRRMPVVERAMRDLNMAKPSSGVPPNLVGMFAGLTFHETLQELGANQTFDTFSAIEPSRFHSDIAALMLAITTTDVDSSRLLWFPTSIGRMQSTDSHLFGSAILSWADLYLKDGNVRNLELIFQILMCFETIDLPSILNMIINLLETTADSEAIFNLANETLEALDKDSVDVQRPQILFFRSLRKIDAAASGCLDQIQSIKGFLEKVHQNPSWTVSAHLRSGIGSNLISGLSHQYLRRALLGDQHSLTVYKSRRIFDLHVKSLAQAMDGWSINAQVEALILNLSASDLIPRFLYLHQLLSSSLSRESDLRYIASTIVKHADEGSDEQMWLWLSWFTNLTDLYKIDLVHFLEAELLKALPGHPREYEERYNSRASRMEKVLRLAKSLSADIRPKSDHATFAQLSSKVSLLSQMLEEGKLYNQSDAHSIFVIFIWLLRRQLSRQLTVYDATPFTQTMRSLCIILRRYYQLPRPGKSAEVHDLLLKFSDSAPKGFEATEMRLPWQLSEHLFRQSSPTRSSDYVSVSGFNCILSNLEG